MTYDEFLLSILSDKTPMEKKPEKRLPEQIEADFLRIAEISRKREG